MQATAFGIVEKDPGAQGAQTRSAAAVPSLCTYWPALQFVHLVQTGAFRVVEKDPAAQGAQTRSAAAVPSLCTYWPALQFVHLVQTGAFRVVEKDPEAQGTQKRSAVADPSKRTRWPAVQSLQGVQFAAPERELDSGGQGEHSMAPSGAKVPSAHVTQGVAPVPSAEALPAGQGPQT